MSLLAMITVPDTSYFAFKNCMRPFSALRMLFPVVQLAYTDTPNKHTYAQLMRFSAATTSEARCLRTLSEPVDVSIVPNHITLEFYQLINPSESGWDAVYPSRNCQLKKHDSQTAVKAELWHAQGLDIPASATVVHGEGRVPCIYAC